MPAHKRILLKLSGEALMGDDAFGINRATIVRMVEEIADVTRLGVQVAIVIGGGNIFRGVAGGSVGMDRATADYMGMLATVMNSLALGDAMEKAGVKARVMSAIAIDQVVERMTAGLTPNPRVIALDNNQPGSATTRGYPPMSDYIATHVDAARIGLPRGHRQCQPGCGRRPVAVAHRRQIGAQAQSRAGSGAVFGVGAFADKAFKDQVQDLSTQPRIRFGAQRV